MRINFSHQSEAILRAKVSASNSAAFLIFLPATAGTRLVPADLRLRLPNWRGDSLRFDLRRVGFLPVETCPPFHFLDDVPNHAVMTVGLCSCQKPRCTQPEIVPNIINADVSWIDQPIAISELDVLHQIDAVKV